MPWEPTDAHVLLPAATTKCGREPEAPRRRSGERCSCRGGHCTAAEDARLPSASTASATWLARTGDVRCCFAHSLVARPSSRRARERAMAWGRRRRKPRAARRAMMEATIDETTELSSARCGDATECGAARFGARGQGWAFGADSNVLPHVCWGHPTRKQNRSFHSRRLIKRGMHQPRRAPSPHCICIGSDFLGGLP